MSKRHFNTDNPADVAELLRIHPPDRRFEFKKLTKYGSGAAERKGLRPIESIPDGVVAFDDVESVIKHAEAMKSFPAYYLQNTWCPKGTSYNQDGLGYCWTWSGTGCVMTCRAMEDKDTVLLSPVSMGYLVNWRNEGNYLEDYVQGAMQEGVHPVVDGSNFNDTTRSASRYPVDATVRKLYRLKNVWDTNSGAGDKVMLCQSLTCLINKCSGFVAYLFWGHAVELAAWLWTPGTYLNVTALIHNSHNETDFITLEGSKCIPSEFIGFQSTVPV